LQYLYFTEKRESTIINPKIKVENLTSTLDHTSTGNRRLLKLVRV
jgi:hypothetical protein